MSSQEFWQQVFLAHINQQIQIHTAVSYSDNAMKAYEDRFALVAEKPSQPAAEEQLLPCPVCGGTPMVVYSGHQSVEVKCEHTNTRFGAIISDIWTLYYPTRGEAIAIWNSMHR